MSRKSTRGAGRTNVLEGDRLRISDETASRRITSHTGESGRPLEEITWPAFRRWGSIQDGKSCTIDCLDVELCPSALAEERLFRDFLIGRLIALRGRVPKPPGLLESFVDEIP